MYHGRGRGAQTLRDEDGRALPSAGPPQLYPKVQVPPQPVLDETDLALLDRKRALEKAYRESPYFLTLPTAKKDDVEVERYSDRLRGAPAADKLPLTAVLTLQHRYFPSELWAKGDGRRRGRAGARRAAAAGAGARGAALFDSDDEPLDTARLEQLAEAEQRAERGRGGAAAAADDDEDGPVTLRGAARRGRKRSAAGDGLLDDEVGGGAAEEEEEGSSGESEDDELDVGGIEGGDESDDDDLGGEGGGDGDAVFN
jgi:DNA-directed RNA polymerase III subunit Rpc31